MENGDKKYRLSFVYVCLLLIFLIANACSDADSVEEEDKDVVEAYKFDIDEIVERGTLKAITNYSSTSYFLYRGATMGYDYELLTRMANDFGLELEIVIAEDLDEIFNMLKRGDGDIIAMNLTVTRDRADRIAFTQHHNTTRQVLVQRKPENWRVLRASTLDRELIRDPIDLLGKDVHVWENSSFYARLINLSEEIGGEINIRKVPGYKDTEELMRMVSDGEIEYTVADENIARVVSSYYDNLDISTPLSFSQRVAWAVRKSSPCLLEDVNNWLTQMQSLPDYRYIYNRYYENRQAHKRRAESEFFSLGAGGSISIFDDLLRQQSASIGWDWRLIAALIYQESRFNPYAESWAGAVGLMQLMPATAQFVGVANLHDPMESIRGGTRYLQWLNDYWEPHIEDEQERLKFVLASYNVGYGHVMDARRLAEKYGHDPDIWTGHVDIYIRKKSMERYYTDEVVRHGYCRGEEPYNYVKNIMTRYNNYKLLIPLDEEELGEQRLIGMH